MKIFTHTALLVLLLAVVATGCSSSNGEPQRQQEEEAPTTRSVRVETLEVTPTTFEDVIEMTGTVDAVADARLSAQAAGTVVRLAPLGAYVPAGQAVAQLDPAQASASVQQAEAAVEAAQAAFDLAEDNLSRQEPLYRDSVISALEFENVRAQYNQAQAQLSQARASLAQTQDRLKNTRVVAPFSGTVEERFAEEGEQVTPGMPIARVVNTSRVKVTAGVPERYASDIELGTPVQVGLKAYGGETLQGRVTFVGSAINPDSRTFPIEVEIDNADRRLKPQMVATLYVTRAELEDVLVVPRSAIIHDENGNHVFVVDETGDGAVAQRQSVLLGPGYGGEVVVQGLEPGAEIVVLGQSNLTPGDRVEVTDSYAGPGAAGEPLAGRE